MATENLHVPATVSDWNPPASGRSAVAAPELARTPVNDGLIEVASDMAPGKALDLGCGEGQNSIWLAQRGWVVTGVDISPGAITEARAVAAEAGVAAVFDVTDITRWRPASRFDLVVATFSLPARGTGRSRMLEMAAEAVAPGGTILLTELDISLARQAGLAERYLVSAEELERHLGGFRVHRSGVRIARQRHGYDELMLPAASVVATRRTDLRSLY